MARKIRPGKSVRITITNHNGRVVQILNDIVFVRDANGKLDSAHITMIEPLEGAPVPAPEAPKPVNKDTSKSDEAPKAAPTEDSDWYDRLFGDRK